MSRIAVVGAGMAGLACARALIAAGHDVRVFDKGRGVGGRIATRRADGASFNHGAQHATARDPGFAALIDEMRAAGVVAPWLAATGAGEPRWVGVPGMSALPRAMTVPDVSLHRHVAFLHRGDDGWMLRHMDATAAKPGTVSDQGGDLAGPFDGVALALPGPQAAPLLAAIAHPFADAAAGISYAPCWAVMAAFAAAVPGPDTMRAAADSLGWAARESSRPGSPACPLDAWTLHATGAWSREHLEDNASAVRATLLADFAARTGDTAAPVSVAAHRWRYALVERALGQPCLWDATLRLGACGDWCLEGRVEAAFRSGVALAEAIGRST